MSTGDGTLRDRSEARKDSRSGQSRRAGRRVQRAGCCDFEFLLMRGRQGFFDRWKRASKTGIARTVTLLQEDDGAAAQHGARERLRVTLVAARLVAKG